MVTAAPHAKILGVSIADKFLFTDGVNVPLHAKAVILFAVLVSMGTTYLTVRQSMKRGMMPQATADNPMGQSQKYMAYIMPFFALTGLYWPFGLVLYWVTTNVWTLIQQWALFKRYPWTPPSAVVTAGGAAAAPALAPKGISSRPKASPNGSTSNGPARPGPRRTAAGERQARGEWLRGQWLRGQWLRGEWLRGGEQAGRERQARGERQAGRSGRPAATGRTQTGSAAGDAQANGTPGAGMLRKLGRSKAAEPEPEPEPEVKFVRQQRQRQSRSKRSGGKN